ncbi:MAG: thymidine phosphorylase [Chthonomonas sp.]|nr:thymidine phosphorylase [Chthonomonas sp.]
MNILGFIADRRDARVHTTAQIDEFVQALTAGEIPDYQVSAWLMAAVLRPMTSAETAALTLAMAKSGSRLDLSRMKKPWVDKHSTGGVGDKTTIVLLPLLAACGLSVVKMSGRGLGITGGTVDKLESVPGFNVNLAPEAMVDQAAHIGLALTGQTPLLAPADKILYALRDATATVESIPLIASSILSKKIAGGAETIVLDVKCGSGAFMRELADAQQLASALKQIGAECGVRVEAVISDMDQPLGEACGNAIEVAEAARVLCRRGPARLTELCIHLAGVTLHACGLAPSLDAGRATAKDKLESGQALFRAEEWFTAQGANPRFLSDESWVPKAPVKGVIQHQGAAETVRRIPAGVVGQAVVDLGGGRKTKDAKINHAVGIECHIRVGDLVQPGQALFTIHASDENSAIAARNAILPAIEWSTSPVMPRPLVLG